MLQPSLVASPHPLLQMAQRTNGFHNRLEKEPSLFINVYLVYFYFYLNCTLRIKTRIFKSKEIDIKNWQMFPKTNQISQIHTKKRTNFSQFLFPKKGQIC
jgi:hypothetical protein